MLRSSYRQAVGSSLKLIQNKESLFTRGLVLYRQESSNRREELDISFCLTFFSFPVKNVALDI